MDENFHIFTLELHGFKLNPYYHDYNSEASVICTRPQLKPKTLLLEDQQDTRNFLEEHQMVFKKFECPSPDGLSLLALILSIVNLFILIFIVISYRFKLKREIA